MFDQTNPMTGEQQRALDHLRSLTEMARCGMDPSKQCVYEAGGTNNGIQLFQMGVTDTDMRCFSLLPEWHIITLRECPVSDSGFRHLANQKGLRFLDIAQTEVTTLDPVRECLHLRHLECDQLERMTDSGAIALANFQELRFLDLGDTATGDATAERLAALTELRKLNHCWTKITDEGLRAIGTLPKLEMLSLYHTSITDEGLRHLHVLPQLRLLAVGYTHVTKKGKSALRKACPDLKVEEYHSIY